MFFDKPHQRTVSCPQSRMNRGLCRDGNDQVMDNLKIMIGNAIRNESPMS